MDEFFSDLDEQPKPKRRGLKPGSKNRSDAEINASKVIERSFQRLRPYCNEEERAYLDRVLRGEIEMDTLVEFRLLIRQLMLVFADETEDMLTGDRSPSKEYAELANALRMTLKDSEDIRKARKKEDEAAAKDDTLHFEEVKEERRRIEEAMNRIGGGSP